MFTVALTGGIASGKTTVSELFKEKNIPIIDTDIIARNLVETDKPAYKEIIKTFGNTITNQDKSLNRAKLRELVFSSDEKRLQLEQILHPLIWQEVASQLAVLNTTYAIVVVPLLFETREKNKTKQLNLNSVHFDRILVIDIPEKEQLSRAQSRDKTDESIIRNILKSQVPAKIRLEGADDILDNTDNKEKLKKEVEALHQKYLSLAK